MKLILVEWKDTFVDVGWSGGGKDLKVISVSSIGWLIHKDKEKIVISSMIGRAGLDDFNCRQAIPRGCIASIKQINLEGNP